MRTEPRPFSTNDADWEALRAELGELEDGLDAVRQFASAIDRRDMPTGDQLAALLGFASYKISLIRDQVITMRNNAHKGLE